MGPAESEAGFSRHRICRSWGWGAGRPVVVVAPEEDHPQHQQCGGDDDATVEKGKAARQDRTGNHHQGYPDPGPRAGKITKQTLADRLAFAFSGDQQPADGIKGDSHTGEDQGGESGPDHPRRQVEFLGDAQCSPGQIPAVDWPVQRYRVWSCRVVHVIHCA